MGANEGDWQVEYAKSGRSKCRLSGTAIAAGALRIGEVIKDAERGFTYPVWYDFESFAKNPSTVERARGKSIIGLETLSGDDQNRVKLVIAGGSYAAAAITARATPAAPAAAAKEEAKPARGGRGGRGARGGRGRGAAAAKAAPKKAAPKRKRYADSDDDGNDDDSDGDFGGGSASDSDDDASDAASSDEESEAEDSDDSEGSYGRGRGRYGRGRNTYAAKKSRYQPPAPAALPVLPSVSLPATSLFGQPQLDANVLLSLNPFQQVQQPTTAGFSFGSSFGTSSSFGAAAPSAPSSIFGQVQQQPTVAPKKVAFSSAPDTNMANIFKQLDTIHSKEQEQETAAAAQQPAVRVMTQEEFVMSFLGYMANTAPPSDVAMSLDMLKEHSAVEKLITDMNPVEMQIMLTRIVKNNPQAADLLKEEAVKIRANPNVQIVEIAG